MVHHYKMSFALCMNFLPSASSPGPGWAKGIWVPISVVTGQSSNLTSSTSPPPLAGCLSSFHLFPLRVSAANGLGLLLHHWHCYLQPHYFERCQPPAERLTFAGAMIPGFILPRSGERLFFSKSWNYIIKPSFRKHFLLFSCFWLINIQMHKNLIRFWCKKRLLVKKNSVS